MTRVGCTFVSRAASTSRTLLCLSAQLPALSYGASANGVGRSNNNSNSSGAFLSAVRCPARPLFTNAKKQAVPGGDGGARVETLANPFAGSSSSSGSGDKGKEKSTRGGGESSPSGGQVGEEQLPSLQQLKQELPSSEELQAALERDGGLDGYIVDDTNDDD